jgi:uncharacterized circularly permuted ATP-grasp superfamily protein/uncharacterized alpha-E superfamily protein
MPLSTYLPDVSTYDALVGPDGAPREAWEDFGLHLGRIATAGELRTLQDTAERALVATGAGHLIAEAERGEASAQPFRFDPVPVIIDAAEWTVLERGMAQRARLLAAVLRDVYGPQTTVTSGVIPAAVLYGTRSYLRAALGAAAQAELIRCATDVVRDAEGRFVAMLDHTDVPVGVGYALSYRDASARILADGIRGRSIRNSTAWLASLRDAISAAAPQSRESPRTVVLASTASSRYIDHSILATRLGYHLAEDGDLAVAGHRLVLRSLTGPEQIDGVLRCTAATASDPLDVVRSSGGVPGLALLQRRGLVGVANPIGSGFAGHLALQPFLAELCLFLLGEPLLLANVETLWCGNPDHRSAVLGDLGGWVLHDVGDASAQSAAESGVSVFGDDLDDRSAQRWSGAIARNPERFVAQRKLRLATTPVLADGRLRPGVASIRLFAALRGDAVSVMPGGVGRVLTPSVPVVTQASAIGKDVWVRADPRPDDADDAGVAVVAAAMIRLPQVDLGASVPTRAAEAMYWMGRNAERADTVARVAAVILTRLESDPAITDLGDGQLAHALANAVLAVSGGHVALTGEELITRSIEIALGERPGALGESTVRLVGGAAQVRQFLSSATWRVLAPLPGDVAGARREFAKTTAGDGIAPLSVEALERVTLSLAAFSGLASDSLVRSHAWRFLEIGRRIERSLLVLGLVEALLAPLRPGVDQVAMETLLASCESLVAYRRRHRSVPEIDTVAANLLADADNPRSVVFQLDALHATIGKLPERNAIALHRRTIADAKRACLIPASSPEEVLVRVLAVRGLMLGLSDAIPAVWFTASHATARRVRAGRR